MQRWCWYVSKRRATECVVNGGTEPKRCNYGLIILNHFRNAEVPTSLVLVISVTLSPDEAPHFFAIHLKNTFKIDCTRALRSAFRSSDMIVDETRLQLI